MALQGSAFAAVAVVSAPSNAKLALEKIAMGRNAECVANRQSYDRVVATCRIGGRSIGDLLKAAGSIEGGNGYSQGKQ